MADSSLRALYQVLAESKDMSVFNAAMADFLTLPSIESVGLAGYHGAIGDPIHITARDAFGVVSVQVSVLDMAGATPEQVHDVERGEAEQAHQQMADRVAKLEQAGDGPAGRERDAEHLGADEDQHADDGQEVRPVKVVAAGQDAVLYGCRTRH